MPLKPQRIASSHRRALAFFIDFSLFVLLVRFFLLPFFYPLNWDRLDFYYILKINLICYFSASLLFLAKDSFGAQSFGKWMLLIKVIQLQETMDNAKLKQCFLRNIFLYLFPLELILGFINKQHRRWGDKFAGTAVVMSPQPFVLRQLTNRLLATIIVICCLWSGYRLSTPLLINKSSFFTAALASISDLPLEISDDYSVGYFKQLFNDEGLMVLILAVKSGDKENLLRWEFEYQADQWQIKNLPIN